MLSIIRDIVLLALIFRASRMAVRCQSQAEYITDATETETSSDTSLESTDMVALFSTGDDKTTSQGSRFPSSSPASFTMTSVHGYSKFPSSLNLKTTDILETDTETSGNPSRQSTETSALFSTSDDVSFFPSSSSASFKMTNEHTYSNSHSSLAPFKTTNTYTDIKYPSSPASLKTINVHSNSKFPSSPTSFKTTDARNDVDLLTEFIFPSSPALTTNVRTDDKLLTGLLFPSSPAKTVYTLTNPNLLTTFGNEPTENMNGKTSIRKLPPSKKITPTTVPGIESTEHTNTHATKMSQVTDHRDQTSETKQFTHEEESTIRKTSSIVNLNSLLILVLICLAISFINFGLICVFSVVCKSRLARIQALVHNSPKSCNNHDDKGSTNQCPKTDESRGDSRHDGNGDNIYETPINKENSQKTNSTESSNANKDVNGTPRNKKDGEPEAADTWLFSSVSAQPSTGFMAYSTMLDIETQANTNGEDEMKLEHIVGIEAPAGFETAELEATSTFAQLDSAELEATSTFAQLEVI